MSGDPGEPAALDAPYPPLRERVDPEGTAFTDACGRSPGDESDPEGDAALPGTLYEERLPAAERGALGKFYTPSALAVSICEWAIPDTDGEVPRVLDPAAGSGRFLVEAYDHIERAVPSATPGKILDRIVAVDIDRDSLRLAPLALATRGVERPGRLRTHAASFFDLAPGAGPGADDALGRFDAVVGNPPYIRQENLSPDAAHFREHLRAYGPEGAAPYADGDRALSTKADAYVYFVTHGLRFLRDGGRLAYVVPSKWLDTRYGEDLQAVLYENARLSAVVGFSARAFDALVDTVVLFVERCDDPAARDRTVTDFVRLAEPVAPETLAGIVATDRSVPDDQPFAIETADVYRAVSVPQRRLAARGGSKLSYYLQAPTRFIPLVESDRLVRLDAYADVSFGHKTGNNAFFLLDGADVDRWDLPREFLRPAVRSLRDIGTRRLTETDHYLLDMHGYVEAIRERRGGLARDADLAAEVKAALYEDGHDAVLDYLRHGEAEGVPGGRTVSQRTPWFDLGELPAPEVLHPVFYDERVFTVENAGGFAPTNAIQRVDVTDHEDVVPHLLNSTLHKVLLELWGRHEGGGALQLLTYEVASVPILDPAGLSAPERAAIRTVGERLLDGDEDAQTALDEAVLAPLDIDLSAAGLQAAHEAMLRRRVDGAAEASVQVRRAADRDGV